MDLFSKFFPEEVDKLKHIAEKGPDQFGGGWTSEGMPDEYGSYCAFLARPGSPLRRLVDMGLVEEIRARTAQHYSWKWEVTKKGQELLDALAEENHGD